LDTKLTVGSDTTSIDKDYLPALHYYVCFCIEAVRYNTEGAMFWLGLYDREVNSLGKSKVVEAKR